MTFQEISIKIKKNKVLYYIKNFLRQTIPPIIHEKLLKRKLLIISKYDKEYINDRVNYYNKLIRPVEIGENAISLIEMRKIKSPKSYYFDTFEFTRYFNQNFKANLLFEDVIHIPDVPTIQKSRPINGNNKNAVILKLDKKRHFIFIKDNEKFTEKKNLIIGRGAMKQPHRIRFMEMYFNSPLCDLGQVNKVGGNTKWIKPKIAITAHLKYKFILSLEGNDVATNLKWIMSSHSIAVMPKPKYETWFMEGKLIPNFHYILIKDDFSDLEERLNYYINHSDEAETIINNANEYIKQFQNEKLEDLISLLVLQKYFYCTEQIA